MTGEGKQGDQGIAGITILSRSHINCVVIIGGFVFMQLVAWEGMANNLQPDYPPLYRPQVPAREIVPALWFWLVCLIHGMACGP